MAKYRKVDPRIWNDQKFNSLSVQGKLAFLFLLTHPHMTALGAMRATITGLASEVEGIDEKAFREAFDKGMAKSDDKACFLWLPRFLRYNPPESPNVVVAWSKALDLLPECSLKCELIQQVKDYTEGLSEAFQKALPKDFAKSMPIQEQEQEQEQEKNSTLTGTCDSKLPQCPHNEIIKAYNKILPELPQCKTFSDQYKKMLRTRWREDEGRQSVEWWENLFEYEIKASDFLMGKVNGFTADLTWIVRPKNFTKIVNGNYRNKTKPKKTTPDWL